MTYIELAVTACMVTSPTTCQTIAFPTGYQTEAECNKNGMILAAGAILDKVGLMPDHYTCTQKEVQKDT